MRSLTSCERLARSRELGILVDEQDEWLLSALTWRIHTSGHVFSAITISGRLISVQFAHYLVGYPIYANECIDHIDRNPLNNRRNNLRYLGYGKNRLNSHSSDAVTHVYKRDNGTYQVVIQRDHISHKLGTYKTEDEAMAVVALWKGGYNA